MSENDSNNQNFSTNNEQPPVAETNNNHEKGHTALEKVKKALILVCIPLILRGIAGGNKDLVKTKEFLETKGYDFTDYVEDPFKDILEYSEETNTIIVGQPAPIEAIVQRNLDVSDENLDEVVDYVNTLNAGNSDIYKNTAGELSADSRLELPQGVSIQSPIKEILDYVYGDEIASFTGDKPDEAGNTEAQPGYTIENGAGFSNEYKTITIESGDSLDGYAHDLCNKAGIQSTEDIIDTIVGYIMNINHLSSTLIIAGDPIKLPTDLPESFKIKNNTQPISQPTTESNTQY